MRRKGKNSVLLGVTKKLKAKAKPAAKTPKNRQTQTVRPHVVSFRITAAQDKTLNETFSRDAASGVNSTNQLARKVVCDYLAGRMEYLNPDDKLQDLDMIGA